MKSEQFKKRILRALKTNRKILKRKDLAPAAVLVPIVFRNDRPHLIVTKRTMTVATHKGQISFPGGMRELEDRDEIENALRETHEEIGLDPQSVEVLGIMDDFETITGFVVTPVVGFVASKAPLQADPTEVAQIIEVPIDDFSNSDCHQLIRGEQDNVPYKFHSYAIQGHTIWGATGGIIYQLLMSLDKVI
jgi:8-oxo-dGTP pyrophosphatase MutT (NUDIX family)